MASRLKILLFMIIALSITHNIATNITEISVASASTVDTEITFPATDYNTENSEQIFNEENNSEIINEDNKPMTVIDLFNGRKFMRSKLNKNQLRNITISTKQKQTQQPQQSQQQIKKDKKKKRRNSVVQNAIRRAALHGYNTMIDFYDRKEPNMFKKGYFLDPDSPGARLSTFSMQFGNETNEQNHKAAYASLIAAKKLKQSLNLDFIGLGRQAPPRISLKRTPLEGLCPPRDNPRCLPASRRYRTHDGTCNNDRRPRWGAAQMPFHRFLSPDYADGIENIRRSLVGGQLPSARFVSLLIHGSRESESPVTMMLAQWGQFVDHDLTSTAQQRSFNGSVPQCCGVMELHAACLPIKVPHDDPWLGPLEVRCLEFLRSAPAQRRDCVLSWREQTNQVTSYLDASPVYSSNPRTSDNARIFRDGLLLFGRGPPKEDVCLRGALANQCIRPGDGRSGEQPGLLAMHTVFVGEHNRIATELGHLNPHWSDEKIYQEARRIIGAFIQHITYREFLPLVLGKEVCRLFDLDLETSGYYSRYDFRVNPGVANSFAAAAFRFGHSLIQGTFLRSDRNHNFLTNNVTLHEETARGDIGGPGSLHRLLRGMVNQRTQKRDEFITVELTNHLFQTNSFPFGLDLAAINIQRGRDHGLPSYTSWRVPCGLTPINNWGDIERVIGPASASRIQQAYNDVDDIDLFVGGLAERPVIGGLVGPTFACIIAQQFSNLRKGDRFWYENPSLESSFTPAQLESIRQVTLAQILCRTFGGGTLQPHALLPSEMIGNSRQVCGEGVLAPIDLLPWTEHDPFKKNNDQDILQDTNTAKPTIMTNIFKPNRFGQLTASIDTKQSETVSVVSNVDFSPHSIIGVHNPLDMTTFTKTNKTKINNKLDVLSAQTSENKQKIKLTTTAPKITVNNKLDATATTKRRPVRVGQHVTRPTNNRLVLNNTKTKRTTTVKPIILTSNSVGQKRPPVTTNNKIQTLKKQNVQNKKQINRRQQPTNAQGREENFVKTLGIDNSFKNEDNASVYLDNRAVRYDGPLTDNDIKKSIYVPETNIKRHKVIISTPSTNSFDIEINIKPKPDSVTNQHEHKYADSDEDYDNDRPIYLNSKPTYNYETFTSRPDDYISSNGQSYSERPNKFSTPFSYDVKKTSRYPSYSSSQRPNYDGWNSNYQTTRKPDLQTFFIVETTKRTTPYPYYPSNKPTWTQQRPNNDNYNTQTNYGISNLNPSISSAFSNYNNNNNNNNNYNQYFSPSSTSSSNPYLSSSSYSSAVQFSSSNLPSYSMLSLPRPMTTKRPIYRPQTLDFSHYSKLLLPVSDDTSSRSESSISFSSISTTMAPIAAFDDYDLTTYLPILNDDFNEDETEQKHSFDVDGYLRPEHMNLTHLMTATDDKLDNFDDRLQRNFNKTIISEITDDDETYIQTETLNDENTSDVDLTTYYEESIPRSPLFDIYSDDDYDTTFITNAEIKNNDNNTMTEIQKDLPDDDKYLTREGKKSSIAFAPLVVINSADRPDNWAIFDAPKKKPLPKLPQLERDNDASTEIPKPILRKFKKH